MENKKIFSLGMILVLAVLMTSTVLAFGVSSPYWKGNPLQIYPSETKTVKITYQNMGEGVEDITMRAEITKGQEIASLSQEEYLVRANTKDTTVEVAVSIPEGTPIGANYQVTLTSSSVTPGAEGGVAIGVGMDTTFDVEVIEKPKPQYAELTPLELPQESPETTGIVLFVALAVLIVAIVLLTIIKMRKKK